MSKTTKALKKQATQAQSVAQRTADAFAEQMSTLAFRAQAAVLKRKRKKK
jgi:ribosomal protein S21